MHIDEIRHYLESQQESRPLFQEWSLRDPERGFQNLTRLAQAIGAEKLRELSQPLARLLPRSPDPDMALNSLERFLGNPAGAQQLPRLIEGRARTLEKLLQLFSSSQYFSDLLAIYPEYVDMLRIPLRRSPSLRELREQLQRDGEVQFPHPGCEPEHY